MRQENRFPFHLIWHLTAGMTIAYAIAFMMLHGYSTRFAELSFWQAVWRTITYVIPQWHFIIIPAGLIVIVLSIGIHGFLSFLSDSFRHLTLYLVFTIIAGGVFVLVFQVFSLYIIIPTFIECLILSRIDAALDKQFEDKPKRKDSL
jgi:hypothetical protein